MKRIFIAFACAALGCDSQPSSLPSPPAPTIAPAVELQEVYIRESKVLEGLEHELNAIRLRASAELSTMQLSQQIAAAAKGHDQVAEKQAVVEVAKIKSKLASIEKEEAAQLKLIESQRRRVKEAKDSLDLR